MGARHSAAKALPMNAIMMYMSRQQSSDLQHNDGLHAIQEPNPGVAIYERGVQEI